MTATEYWSALVARNPKLKNNETVTIRVAGIRAMVEQSHAKGMEHARKEQHHFNDIFEKIFQ